VACGDGGGTQKSTSLMDIQNEVEFNFSGVACTAGQPSSTNNAHMAIAEYAKKLKFTARLERQDNRILLSESYLSNSNPACRITNVSSVLSMSSVNSEMGTTVKATNENQYLLVDERLECSSTCKTDECDPSQSVYGETPVVILMTNSSLKLFKIEENGNPMFQCTDAKGLPGLEFHK